MSTSTGDGPQIRIERLFHASIDVVFAAWTDPATMATWLSPTGRADVDADVRPGGDLRVVMLGDGVRIEHTGRYLVVEPPRLLSFTWQSPYTGDTPSVVTVELSATNGATLLVLRHERLPDAAAESHEGGWTSILDRLAGALEGGHP